MEKESVDASVTIIRGLLVAGVPEDMATESLGRLREAILTRLRERRCRFAVLDCARVEAMDESDAAFLLKIFAAASLMGATPVICGLQPGVAAFLAGLDPKLLRGIRIARDIDDALSLENAG